MYKKTYKLLLALSLISISTISFATGTIQINGNIVEDTCTTHHHNPDCERINDLFKKINNQSTSLEDLNNQSQKNSITEIKVEPLPDERSAVIIASYY
ncbi:type 1 fimbrial protein [Acinetobacter sp. NIPH 1852]|uniref:type 1 fimbrial protein n=1 Tax=Acinetobacter sp. NIPH 1852 TaxID=2923428 RepID=UPI001F4A526D|nr:type 1 fimbrial protein [Acinetobacter sp. NIPH 1852]MCH7307917.1 type 1 fimbrial protein [Acinetobacter sp. NIPH 1852]